MSDATGEEGPLREKISMLCDDLWNVVALLEAAALVTSPGDSVDQDQSNRMRRLVYVAEAEVRGVIEAFNP